MGGISEASERHLGGIWESSRRFSPLAKEFSRLILELVFVDFYQCWMAVGLYFGTFGLTFGTLERSLGPPGRLLGPRPLKTSKRSFFGTSFWTTFWVII